MEFPLLLVAAYTLGIGVLYFLGWLLLVPLKFLNKLLFNAVAGGVLLMLMSIAGGLFDMNVTVNAVTALIAGFLGVPGVALVVLLPMIL